MSAGNCFAAHHLDGALHGDSTHLRRELRDRRLHRPGRDGLLGVVERIEADDADLAGLAGCGNRLDRAERHQVAGGKHRVDVLVRLEHVLKDVEPLVAFPVRGL